MVFNLTDGTASLLVSGLESQAKIKYVTRQKIFKRKLSEFPLCDTRPDRKLKLFGKLWRPPSPGTVPLDRSKQPWKLLHVEKAWSQGHCGAGVRVGIFDTGLVSTSGHPHFARTVVRERTDWTRTPDGLSAEDSMEILRQHDASGQSEEAVDGHGHGTFVAGVIAGTDVSLEAIFAGEETETLACPQPGIAPLAELYIFRVFTDTQVSYTSWFLDAFNYAITRKLHVINLSIGGPDFLDQPFVDKVWELSSNGILLVSAIGNDGPLFGTLNNPADQMDVLGVGGVDATGRIARFSSRGMTSWALPFGYGQVKPDVVTFSTGVISSGLDQKCRVLSGTSVASPVVTGIVALLISAATEHNLQVTANGTLLSDSTVPINPASIKQALIGAAVPLSNVQVFGTKSVRWPQTTDTSGIFEQGAGLVDFTESLRIMERMKPQATLIPSYLDLTQCPYMWPYCSQPLYATMQPVVVNVTVLNSLAVVGSIDEPPIYHPYMDRNGDLLRVRFTYSRRLWPWVGFLAIHLDVQPGATRSAQFSGVAEGFITLTVRSQMEFGGRTAESHLVLPIRANIVPTPDRSRRILFDQFHSLRYPSAYIPRDDLTRKNEPLDWLGDHIHTNYRDLYLHLRKSNYYVEVLTGPFTCFSATNYGSLLLVDPEEEFFPEEIEKLFADVTFYGLSLIVFAEWYNTTVIDSLRFFDTNTRRLWIPETGGANLPALNDLLRPFGVQLGDSVYAGDIKIGRRKVPFSSGTSLLKFPQQNISSLIGHGSVLRARLVDLGDQFIRQYRKSTAFANERLNKDNMDTDPDIKQNSPADWRLTPGADDPSPPILGIWTPLVVPSPGGRLAVFGDSDCLSSTHITTNCFWLADALLQFTTSRLGRIPRPLAEQMVQATATNLDSNARVPLRPENSSLYRISNVLRNDKKFFTMDGLLPSEAYQKLRDCPELNESIVIPATTNSSNVPVYGPQPLKLYPPLQKFTFKRGCSFHHKEGETSSKQYFPHFPSRPDLGFLWFDSFIVYTLIVLFILLLYKHVFHFRGLILWCLNATARSYARLRYRLRFYFFRLIAQEQDANPILRDLNLRNLHPLSASH
ncbi:unnamed protein product [Calicophoron daubneyi]|uniref:Membrane-bound transcription factor site-1 protease n=1 Tax=Calicophoron daubneyi TaxID=300641 RepID=A0AAV2TKI9_CALDB